jgi:ATP-dependent Clp protease ATP-binding subunit ClpA
VGYGEKSPLLTFMDTHVRGVLLLDEIEKAHRDASSFLMELFDNGIITDAAGNIHSVRGYLIIMTSNISVYDKKNKVMGFCIADDPGSSMIDPRIEIEKTEVFKKEVLSRINGIVRFEEISPEHIPKIAGILLDKALKRLLFSTTGGIDREEQIRKIAGSYHPSMGVRSMRVFIDTVIIPDLLYNSFRRI